MDIFVLLWLLFFISLIIIILYIVLHITQKEIIFYDKGKLFEIPIKKVNYLIIGLIFSIIFLNVYNGQSSKEVLMQHDQFITDLYYSKDRNELLIYRTIQPRTLIEQLSQLEIIKNGQVKLIKNGHWKKEILVTSNTHAIKKWHFIYKRKGELWWVDGVYKWSTSH